MLASVFHCEAQLRGIGPVDVQLFEKEGNHSRMVVRAGPVSLKQLKCVVIDHDITLLS